MNPGFPIENGIAKLFEPIAIKRLTLANRFVMPGMQRSWCVDGAPVARMARYYRRRIEGGVSLIISESCAVAHPSATAQPLACKMSAETAPAWADCIGEVKDAGGRFFVQLWHEGALRSNSDGRTISPSGLGYPGFERGRAATRRDLDQVVEAFAESARLAQTAGADGVELHSAHGFFLDQFLWAETNTRDDEYGGRTLAERATLHVRILTAIREACGDDLVVSVRFSQWKEKDYAARIAQTSQELGAFLALLSEAGADVFHASARRFWTPEWAHDDKSIAAWTKQLSGMPTIAVGSAGLDRDVMDSFSREGEAAGTVPQTIERMSAGLAAGHFDLFAIGRSLIGDPDWVKKLACGEIESIRPFHKSDISDFAWDE